MRAFIFNKHLKKNYLTYVLSVYASAEWYIPSQNSRMSFTSSANRFILELLPMQNMKLMGNVRGKMQSKQININVQNNERAIP